MGEKIRRDGKKNRPKKSGAGQAEPETLENGDGWMERVPTLETVGVPFYEVTENSVKFSLPWKGDTIRWYAGGRYLTRESIIRHAVPMFWEKNYWDHGTSGRVRTHKEQKERKAKGISAIYRTWLRSDAWDGLVDEASRVFRVEEVMND